MTDVGIIGYGASIPRRRIKVEEIAKVWGADAESYKKGLMLTEKSVPANDQDTITLSVEATKRAIKRAGIDPVKIGSVYIGSESHPYAVKPSGTIVAEAIGAVPECHCADFEFACKAGSEAMFVAYSEVLAGTVEYSLAIGADTSQGAPGDALEYSAAAGAAAFIFGKGNPCAIVTHTYSFMTDTPDFWRREYQHYPQHAGRYTGEPAYFKHTLGAGRGILELSGLKADDIDWFIAHQPNGKFPLRAAKTLGFPKEKIKPGWLVPKLGNTYSGASPIGLTATLDIAKPGQKIMMVSYGSGSGSDAFIFEVTDRIDEIRDMVEHTQHQLDHKPIYLDYGNYAKYRGKILKST